MSEYRKISLKTIAAPIGAVVTAPPLITQSKSQEAPAAARASQAR